MFCSIELGLVCFGLGWFVSVVVILGVLFDRTGFGLVCFGLVCFGLLVVVILGQYTD